LVLGGLVAFLVPTAPPLHHLPDVALGAVFIAASYLFGAVGNIAARFLLNRASARTVRARMVVRAAALKGETLKLADASARYSKALDAGLTCGNALIEAEVAKRRNTGRLVRSALLPALLAIWLLPVMRSHMWWSLLAMAGVYLCLLVLYAYSEAVIFGECLRGERVRAASEKPILRTNR
jgi:hypothetical protein